MGSSTELDCASRWPIRTVVGRRLIAFGDLHNNLLRLRLAFNQPRRPVPRDADLIQGDAYLVAAHAAVEFYFEELCRKAVYASLWRYKTAGTVNKVLHALVGCGFHREVLNLPRGADPFASGVEQLKKAVDWYVKRLDENNGVKRNNLLAILLPLGFIETDFDPVWLASMDSFGQGRGDTAHGRPTSSFGRSSLSLTAANATATVHVWSEQAIRTRVALSPWDVAQLISGLTPEMLAWDRRLGAQISAE